MKRATLNYWIDMATGAALVVCAATGIVRLFPAAAAVSDGGTATILGVSSVLWAAIHDWSGVAMAVGTSAHLALHTKWLVNMTGQLFGRDRHRARARRHDVPVSSPKTVVVTPRHGVVQTQAASPTETASRMDRRAFLSNAAAVGGAALLLGLTLTSCDSGSSSTSTSTSKVTIDSASCTGCGECVPVCSHGALAMSGSKAVVQSSESCTLCGHCVQACRSNAITLSN